jgi:hypothetical protein
MDPVSNLARAEEWHTKGNKMLQAPIDFPSAASCFEKAGKFYLLLKEWKLSGDDFSRSAQCLLDFQNDFEAARQFEHAFNAYRLIDHGLAQQAMNKAIRIYMDDGKFAIAARSFQLLSECQNEHEQFLEARDSLVSAELYSAENQTSNAAGVKDGIAKLSIQLKYFKSAAANFESTAKNCAVSSTKKQRYFHAALCHFATNNVSAMDTWIDQHLPADTGLSNHERLAALSILEAMRNRNRPEISNLISTYCLGCSDAKMVTEIGNGILKTLD